MPTRKKIWDIVQPKDNWERAYAHLEYLRIGFQKTTTSDDPGVEKFWSDVVRTQDTLIISRSGCKFIGDKLFHNETYCSCDDEYMESVEI